MATPDIPREPQTGGALARQESPAFIPFKRDAEQGPSLAGGAVGVLLISLLAVAIVLYARRRLNLAPAAAAGKRLKIVETQRLGARTLLSVVEFGGREYLIAQTEQGVTRIADNPMGNNHAS